MPRYCRCTLSVSTAVETITIDGREYPFRATMEVMVRFRQMSGREVIDLNSTVYTVMADSLTQYKNPSIQSGNFAPSGMSQSSAKM